LNNQYGNGINPLHTCKTDWKNHCVSLTKIDRQPGVEILQETRLPLLDGEDKSRDPCWSSQVVTGRT
jgi:hypothetical protein